MKSLIRMVSIALVLAAAVSMVAAADEVMTVKGKTVSVDTKAGTLTVEVTAVAEDSAAQAGSKVTFTVDKATKITKDGAAIRLADIASGDPLTVNFKQSGKSRVALFIGVQSRTTS
jgi:hypothetical protein